MAEELTTALTRRAERGSPRGAGAVFAAAHRQATTVEKGRSVWHTGPAIAFAAAAITLFVVGGALLAMRLVPTDTVSPPVTSTTLPTSPIRVEELVWSRVATGAAVFADARIDGVTVFDGALVAVGEDANGAAVWNSPDGVTWTRTVLDFAPSDQEPELRKVSPGGPGLVAIGGHTVWVSPDGVAWAPSQQTFEHQLEAITQGVPGLVLVGDRVASTSGDGMRWSAGRCPTCSPNGAIDYLADVVSGGPGLVAVGNFDDPGMGPAYFWTSQDGMSWTRILHGEEVEMESVAVGGPGFVAVGHHDGARVLTSPEGTDWTAVPYDAEVFGDSLMRHVFAAGDGLVALGEWHSGDQGDGTQWGSGWFWGDAQVWTSRDGISWKRVPYDAAVFGEAVMNDAVVFGDRLIAVGESKEGRGEVWVASPPGTLPLPASPEGPSPTAQRLVSGDATDPFPWRKTEFTEPWAERIIDVTALPEGGFAVVADRGGSILWSRDGVTWQEADPDGRVSPAELVNWADHEAPIDDTRVITALPGRVAVLGGTVTDPLVWVGDLATGAWESIPLDVTEPTDGFEEIAIASNDHQVLVAAKHSAGLDPADGPHDWRYPVWLIDPDGARAVRSTIPHELFESTWGRDWTDSGLEVEWFGDRWVVAAGNVTAVSEDGLVWTSRPDMGGLAADGRHVTSLAAGTEALIATTCEWAHFTWYSEDGLEWVKAPRLVPGPHSGFAYSDALGFVVVDDGRVFTSKDGRIWHWTRGLNWYDDTYDLAASGTSVLVLADPPFLLTHE